MSEATEKEEVGPEVSPALDPLVKEVPDQVQIQRHEEESSHSVVVEETANPTESTHSLPVEESVSDDKTRVVSSSDVEPPVQELAHSSLLENEQELAKSSVQSVEPDVHDEIKAEASRQPFQVSNVDDNSAVPACEPEHNEHVMEGKVLDSEMPESKTYGDGVNSAPVNPEVAVTSTVAPISIKGENEQMKPEVHQLETPIAKDNGNSSFDHSFLLDGNLDGSESGTEDEQLAFMKELENFFRERRMEFKPPKFYGEGLNCLKLWRAVTKLGGYDKVTACKLWRVVGESFRPPKTCTTVSWTFRGFYEKALLDYERHKTNGGELQFPASTPAEPINVDNQAPGSGRMRRDAAARAMQGWHSQRILGNGEVSDPIIKDKSATAMQKRDKQLKSIGLLKRKKPSYLDSAVKAARSKTSHSQLDTVVVDLGAPADWVKINVQRTKDCFEVYALVPGLLREEVRVQSDPAGRLVISGEPENPDNPWGVTPFKKVVNLPSRIDPHQTSAVVTLHGQLFVRVPFEQTN